MGLIVDWMSEQKLYLLLLMGSVFGFFWLSECKNRLEINNVWALILSVLNSVLGVLFVKIFAFLEGVPGGMSLFGGIFFLPIAYYIGAKISKRNVQDVFDCFALCTIFTVMCARTNCLLSGCCGGTVIPGTDGIKWPTQLIEIVFYIILLTILGKKAGQRKYHGKIYPMYLMAYGVFRFCLEFVREKEVQTIFHLSHLWAVLAVVAGFYFYNRATSKTIGDKHRK